MVHLLPKYLVTFTKLGKKYISQKAEQKGSKGIFKIPLEPSHSILLENPFHGNLLKVERTVDGFTEL